MAVMIDLRGSSANTENLLRIRSRPANRLKETMQWGAAPMPAWHQPNLEQLEWSCYNKEPDLREILDQARQART